MATGYGGTYGGSVVDNVDPLMQNRLQVLVPEVFAEASAWALPSVTPGDDEALPAIGDVVSVSFERGDTDYPVWERGTPTYEEPVRTGYIGKYSGVVVDNVDPLGENRLRVEVPEALGTESSWARASLPAGSEVDLELPAVGADVWVEFENGDLDYPLWVGVP